MIRCLGLYLEAMAIATGFHARELVVAKAGGCLALGRPSPSTTH